MDSMPPSIDKPPPTKQTEDYLKEEIKSIRNGIGGFLLAGFTVGRTLQVFSRAPGSCGVLLHFAWIVGIFIQGFYFIGHVETHGRVDASPYELLICIQVMLWVIGLIITLRSDVRSKKIDPRYLGRGVLKANFPKANDVLIGVVSDILQGLLIIGFFNLVGSPVQAGWYKFILVWVLVCHACAYLRGWSYRRRVRSAMKRSASWREDVRGRHEL